MNNRLLRISLAAALLAALAGCGNKGPLVHPTAPADEIPPPATTVPAMPTETSAPAPATTAPATPVEPTAPPPAGGG